MEKLQTKGFTLDSREVAKMVNKEHRKLLRDIRTYIEYLTETKIGLSDFFNESTYEDSTRRTLPCYQITKKGCELIAHKMTGKKGVQFTAQYINRFHEMEQQLQTGKQLEIEEPYEYFDKFYNDRKVLTIRDIEHFTNCPGYNIRYWIHHGHIIKGRDYYYLEGAELADFKIENPRILKSLRHLYVITESGCRKLSKLLQYNKGWECFKQLPPANKKDKKANKGLPDEPTVQQIIKEAERDMTVLSVTMQKLNAYNTPEKHELYQDMLNDTFESLSKNIGTLRKVQQGKDVVILRLSQVDPEYRKEILDLYEFEGGRRFRGAYTADGREGDVLNAYLGSQGNEQLFLYS